VSEQPCLITGASGFIGGRLVQRLVREGRPVRCLVRASSDVSPLAGLDVELIVGELTQPHSLARAAQGAGAVFHCAALVSDWASTREITQTNVVGTRDLIESCVDASVKRFVHLSTTDVYGHPAGGPIDEHHTATRFHNWYAQTKLEAEAEVRRVAGAHALEAVILRPATVYGPGSKDVVGEIAKAIRARHMLLVGGGRAIAGLCYVENLLDAMLLALEHPAAPGQAFNISDGLDVTWRRFVDDLADGLGCPRARFSLPYWLAGAIGVACEQGYRLARRLTGLSLPPLLSRQAVQVLGRDQDFANRKARELLGWEPRVDYREGMAATIQWLRSEYLTP